MSDVSPPAAAPAGDSAPTTTDAPAEATTDQDGGASSVAEANANASASQPSTDETKPAEQKRPDWLRYQKSLAKLKEQKAGVESERAALNRQAAELREYVDGYQRVMAALKRGDLDTLRQSGLDLNALNRAALEAGSPQAATKQLQQQIEDLKGELQKRDEHAKNAQIEAAKRAYLSEITAGAHTGLAWLAKTYGAESFFRQIETVAEQRGVRDARDPAFLELANDLALQHKDALRRAVTDSDAPPGAAPPSPSSTPKGASAPTTITARAAGESSGASRVFDSDEARQAGVALLKKRRREGALG